MQFEMIRIGDRAEMSDIFPIEKVKLFASLSRDVNPIHLSTEFAANTIFKEPIVHGFLYSSLFSALLANELPGPGSIYKSQTLNFLLPVHHDDKVTAVVEVIKIIEEKRIIYLRTMAYKNDDKNLVVVDGEACIKKVTG